jgi:hypothetical protein
MGQPFTRDIVHAGDSSDWVKIDLACSGSSSALNHVVHVNIMSVTSPVHAAATTTAARPFKHLIRASVQGNVYLIDSPTGNVYTYDPKNPKHNPAYVGKLEKIPEVDKHMISKTNGCLASARIVYRSDIREMMNELRANPEKKFPAPVVS